LTDDYTLTYDAAGNMTSDGKDYNYTYDVFGRLVGIDTTGDSPVKSYRYNGLSWRITDDDGAAEHLVYNEKWQLLARYTGADVREQWIPHTAGLDGDGSGSYIDSMILRTTYTGTGQSVVEDKRFYYAQNWRADVSVVLDDAGVQQERVSYSPYGQPFGIAAGDTDFDGDHDASDDTAITGWNGALKPYRAYADVNLDGSINSSDASAADADSLGWDVLTSDDVLNRIGYAGYTHDRDVAAAAHVRYRVYKIDLGRWVQRDPAGYLGESDLYTYEKPGSGVLSSVDPLGLVPINYRFNLFIDKRFGWELFPGNWYQPEPWFLPGNWWFRTDSRMVGEAGSSRLSTYGSVDSMEIGMVIPSVPNTVQGVSVRYDPLTKVMQSRQGTPIPWYEVAAGNCGSVVHFNVAGQDPFYPVIAPMIRYDVELRFTVTAPNRVRVMARGWHSAYPSAELLLDDRVMYAFYTPYEKASFSGVEFDVEDFGPLVRYLNVPTSARCNQLASALVRYCLAVWPPMPGCESVPGD
jgi:RHS repeat-associated protein